MRTNLHTQYRRSNILLPVLLLLAVNACSSAYYGTLEKLGIEKRDILIDRIDEANRAQEQAKDQFSSALEQYRAVIDIQGGELEETYDRLQSAYEKSAARADTVRQRIDAVEDVADDLFEEWKKEIGTYSDDRLAQRSQELLKDTRGGYSDMLKAMRRAQKSMDPVLTLFHDQVLYLRHNLNARAIDALQNELIGIEAATGEAISEMEIAIAEASEFIKGLE